MNYLIIARSNGQHFLLMREPETKDESATIRAYKTKEEVMNDFESYTKGWTGSYERSMSCTIGMMNMHPVAIEAPETEEKLIPYIKEMKLYHISGGAIGRGYYGLLVKEEILELQQFDIWQESMKLAGII